MKKFLSLVLALVMTMSLVTVSAGAKDFTDADVMNYDEAVSVMSEIGVIGGYTDGSFNPQGNLTRQAAAKIICNMILSPTVAKALPADTAPFKDVPVTSEFAGYIAYCSQQGIISGYADGTFRPAAPLTGYAFMKMLLGALGYDAKLEGFVGPNWSVQVAKRALGNGLNASLVDEFNGVKTVNREEACLYAFNTLKATMVEYDAKTSVSIGGADVVIAGSKAQDVVWTGTNNADGNIKNDGKVQFAERYFSKLVRDTDVDAFGRPVNEWTYKKEDVGSFVNHDLLAETFTEAFDYADLYDVVGSNAAKYFSLYSFLDGDKGSVVKASITKTNDTEVPGSGLGVLTEVFVDVDAEEIYVCSINTYLAKAITDYNVKTGKVTIEVYDGVNTTGAYTTTTATKRLSVEDFAAVEDMAEGDYMMVTMAKGEVKTVADAVVVEDATVSEYSSKPSTNQSTDGTANGRLTKVIADSETYKTAEKAFYDAAFLYDYSKTQLDGYTYDLFLDPYGNLLGVKNITSDEEHFFVVGYEHGATVLAKAVDKALVIFPDGTMKTVNAMEKKGTPIIPQSGYINTWYDYSVNADGVYVISAKTARQFAECRTVGTAGVVDKANTTMATSGTPAFVYGNNDSTYIAVKAEDDVLGTAFTITEVNGVTTGIKNVSIEPTGVIYHDDSTSKVSNVFGLYNTKGYVTTAIVLGDDGSVADNLVYLTSGITSKYYDSAIKSYVYRYDAIVDGEQVSVKSLVAEDDANAKLGAHKLYVASYDADGFITEMEEMTDNVSSGVSNYNTATYKAAGFGVKVVTGTAPTNNEKLTISGAMLYLTASNNDEYAIIDDDCRFYVNGADDDDGEYNEYANASAALAALGKGNEVTPNGKVVIIADTDTGFAKTVIILDAEYEEDPTTPGTPVGGWSAPYTAASGTEYQWHAVNEEIYTANKNVTLAELYSDFAGSSMTVTYYAVNSTGVREKVTVSAPSSSGMTVAGVLAQDSAVITLTNGSGTWTVVNEM